MEFSVNSPILFTLAGITVFVVILQSVVFLIKAYKRALELGVSRDNLKKTVKQTIIFTIAPAIAVGIGVITLCQSLGLPLPWLRLSVVGALPYELTAASKASEALGIALGDPLTATQFTTIAWTMTVGIITGVVLIPLFCKKTVSGLGDAGIKDKKWGEHLSNALFYGLIATFVGQGLSGVTVDAKGKVTALVLLVSALVMCVLGVLRSKFKWAWINDYAIPICMLIAMALAVPFTAWLA